MRLLGIFLLILVISAVGQGPDTTIRTRVNLVVAPTTVTQKNGRFVDGLTAEDFVVLDEGVERRIQVDTSDIALTPISLVVAVQSNQEAFAALNKIRKVGSLVEALITGERGEAAMIGFGDQVVVTQEFTRDADLISKAFRGLKKRGAGARTLDAVARGIEMLAEREEARRRVLVVISESRDRGSETKLAEVLRAAQKANVTVYPVTFSAHATPWTVKSSEFEAGSGRDIIGVVREILRNAKVNDAEEMARFTGGRRVSFLTLGGLEKELAGVGEELHSQYLISFAPGEAGEGEFRRIEVRVKGRAEAVVRSRPGYWSEKR